MKFYSCHIPKDWKPNDRKAMNRWLINLPIVKDLNKVIEIDVKYEQMIKNGKR